MWSNVLSSPRQIVTRDGLTKQLIEAVPTTEIFHSSTRMIQDHGDEYYVQWSNQIYDFYIFKIHCPFLIILFQKL